MALCYAALLLTVVCMLTVQPFIGGWHSLDSVDWAVITAALIAPFVPCILVEQPTCIKYSTLHGVLVTPRHQAVCWQLRQTVCWVCACTLGATW